MIADSAAAGGLGSLAGKDPDAEIRRAAAGALRRLLRTKARTA
jgi:hypothetical protein